MMALARRKALARRRSLARRKALARAVTVVVAMAVAAQAGAQTAPAGSAGAPGAAVDRARESFARGVALVRQEKWAEALREFDRSLAERPHGVTFYNVALCHRALGRTARAVFALERALGAGDELPEATRAEARQLLDELRPRRSFVVLEVDTAGATLTVDGSPVEPLGEAWTVALHGGSSLATSPMRLAVEPGAHVIRLTREGHAPFARELTLAAGESASVRASLPVLPGTLAVGSRPAGGWLQLDGVGVGALPLVLERPAGPYRLEVTAPGRVPFSTEVTLRPGARTDVMAELPAERVSVLRRWWFWTGVGVIVAGAAVTTYALTRPTEKADGGSLGWVVRP